MCDLDEKLKKYEILYTAYADEIRNLWQRSIFLGAFMALAWGGYGALQLKFIEQCLQNICAYHFASLGLCAVIIVLSLLWIAMAKGSKFVQEAHEKHIERYTKNCDCNLFCDLGKYETKLKHKIGRSLILCGTLKPFRYSPSRINIALGWVSWAVGFILLNWHLNHCDKINNVLEFIIDYRMLFMLGLSFVVVWFVALCIGCGLKGGSKSWFVYIWDFLKAALLKAKNKLKA
ncbi:RipA family octameric membrane protein [Helicobacter sp. 23-1045]